MTFRQELAAMAAGYRTAVAEPAPAEPAAEERHAQSAAPAKRRRKTRATMPAKQLSPETKDPSPE
jgi:hypothetical protein